MQHEVRLAYLASWAQRDRDFGLRQARLDEAQFPGITQQVQDVLDLDEEFARARGNCVMVMEEKAKLALPPRTAQTHSVPIPFTHPTRRRARA
jgi:hypothetical protein